MTGTVGSSRAISSARMARLSYSTAKAKRSHVGTSSAPGLVSGMVPISTPKVPMSPLRCWNWLTKGLNAPRRAAMFQTEFEFTLPCGYPDEDGTLHRDGVMRRATAADEILPLKDPRVVKNSAYLVVILLSRVITRLGGVAQVNPKVIENLYATDLAYLQNLYNEVNRLDNGHEILVCPHCQQEFQPERNGLGG